MATPPPFFSSEPRNSHQPGGASSLPPPQNDSSDTDDELLALQASYNNPFEDNHNLHDNDTSHNIPPPFVPPDSPPPPDMIPFSNLHNKKFPPKNPSNKNTNPHNLDDSVTPGTPEPNTFMPPPPPPDTNNNNNNNNNSIPGLHRVPPPPSYGRQSPAHSESVSVDSNSNSNRPPPTMSRNRHASYKKTNVPPPPGASSTKSLPQQHKQKIQQRSRSGRNKSPNRPPQFAGNGMIVTKLDLNYHNKDEDYKCDLIDQVSFTTVLRQVDVGVEMTDRLKEVIRKFCKHQQMGADKLQEIYAKLPSTYQDTDGMQDFADLCALVHTLILETVSAQKRLADFLFKDVVPKMDSYIKEKQQQIQQLKRDNQQAEMKVKNSINSMNKASNTAKTSASKAKHLAQEAHKHSKKQKIKMYEQENKKKKGIFRKFKHNPNSDLPEEEQAYLKAQTNQLNYEAAVMAANYEQDTYNKTQQRFKRDCKGIEQQRLQYCHNKIQQVVSAHRSYFNNETIMVLQTRVLSGLDALDSNKEFDSFLNRNKSAKSNKDMKIIATKYDYQNVFHSLQDSMDITYKLAPHSKLPLMLTSLCNKVRELNGFETEGIFRKSAMATEIDRLKQKLSRNEYILDTKDPHVAACLLKDWLRGLKDSLIPQTHYDIAIQMAKKNEINNQSLEVFLSQLPEVNRETIKYLVTFLKDLIEQKHIPKTRMNIENVSIVFAPTILKCPRHDAKQLLANNRHEKDFTIALIEKLQTY